MSRVVYKYPVSLNEPTIVPMGNVIHFDCDRRSPLPNTSLYAWVEHPNAESLAEDRRAGMPVDRVFPHLKLSVFATGQYIKADSVKARHAGSTVTPGGLVWHLYSEVV